MVYGIGIRQGLDLYWTAIADDQVTETHLKHVIHHPIADNNIKRELTQAFL